MKISFSLHTQTHSLDQSVLLAKMLWGGSVRVRFSPFKQWFLPSTSQAGSHELVFQNMLPASLRTVLGTAERLGWSWGSWRGCPGHRAALDVGPVRLDESGMEV